MTMKHVMQIQIMQWKKCARCVAYTHEVIVTPSLNNIVVEDTEGICPFTVEFEVMHHFHFCTLGPEALVWISMKSQP